MVKFVEKVLSVIEERKPNKGKYLWTFEIWIFRNGQPVNQCNTYVDISSKTRE